MFLDNNVMRATLTEKCFLPVTCPVKIGTTCICLPPKYFYKNDQFIYKSWFFIIFYSLQEIQSASKFQNIFGALELVLKVLWKTWKFLNFLKKKINTLPGHLFTYLGFPDCSWCLKCDIYPGFVMFDVYGLMKFYEGTNVIIFILKT